MDGWGMREHRVLLAKELDEAGCYRLLSGLVVPRPIAWVSTVDSEGTPNLAPFSFFTCASLVPPMLVIAIEPRMGEKKDTLRNIEETGDFVVNVASEDLVRPVVISAVDFPPGQSEFDEAGLTLAPSRLVRAPRVAEAPASMECRLERLVRVGSGPHTLVIGEIVAWQVDPNVLEPTGRVNFQALRPLGRLAGDLYVKCHDLISEPRQDWRKDTY